MKPGIRYEFHHMGIPAVDVREGERFSAAGMYTSDNPGRFRIQWHRFTEQSPLPELTKVLPNVAFKVEDLDAAIDGEEMILGPYEPIDGYFVAVIDDGGIAVELIQTTLSDEQVWARARQGDGVLYRNDANDPVSGQENTAMRQASGKDVIRSMFRDVLQAGDVDEAMIAR